MCTLSCHNSSSLWPVLFLVVWVGSWVRSGRLQQIKIKPEPLAPKKAQIDPFANLRDGASSSTGHQTTGAVVFFSGREELTQYKAMQVPVPMTAHSSSGGRIRNTSLFCHKLPVVCFAFLQALPSQSLTFRLLVTLLLTPGPDCLQAKLNPSNLFAGGCALACCD